MKESKMIIIALLFVSTILGGIGQFLFKDAFLNHHSLVLYLAAGLGGYAISTAIYFYVLSRVHLSWAYAITGISYVVAVFFAAALLAENVTMLRWAGVLIIAFGVLLVGIS